MDEYFTKRNLMIGVGVLVVVIIIIVVAVKMKSEKFVVTDTGKVNSSGTAVGKKMVANTYMVSDKVGNLSTTTDGLFNGINVVGPVLLDSYTGKVGDVIVSNGDNAPPVWAAGVVGMADFKSDIKEKGYQKLPGGLIIQWGYESGFGSSKLVDFPIPFPNAVFSFTATPTLGAAGNTDLTGKNIFMTSNVTKKSFSLNAYVSMAVYWMAIGN